MKKLIILSLIILSACSKESPTTSSGDNSNVADQSQDLAYDNKKDEPKADSGVSEGASFQVYYIQLGAFKTPYFANQLIHKCKKMGYTVHSYKINKNNTDLTVVEIGAFKTKGQALKHRKVLVKRLDLKDKPLLKERIR